MMKEEKYDNLGLDEKEQIVMDKLMECYKAYLDLEIQHPNEIEELGYAIHLIQGLLAMRVIRRVYPKGWPTYKEDIKNESNKTNDLLEKINKKLEMANKMRNNPDVAYWQIDPD